MQTQVIATFPVNDGMLVTNTAVAHRVYFETGDGFHDRTEYWATGWEHTSGSSSSQKQVQVQCTSDKEAIRRAAQFAGWSSL